MAAKKEAEAVPEITEEDTMKLADAAWGWTPIPEDAPHGDSLLEISEKIRAIGFEGIDYLATDESLDSWFTDENCCRLGAHARDIGLEPNVMVYQASKPWNHPDASVREHLLKNRGAGYCEGTRTADVH